MYIYIIMISKGPIFILFVDNLLTAKINKHKCTAYDHVHPQKLNSENFEDRYSAKLGPHEISCYTVLIFDIPYWLVHSSVLLGRAL